MLENLFNLIKGEAHQEIIDNPAIPNEHNNQAVGTVTESIFSGLQGALSGGGLQSVLNLFSGKEQAGIQNPLVGGIANNVVKSLMSKFGIDNPIAQGIASSLVPKVLGNLVNKTKDPNDNGFDMNGIIGSLIGGGNHGGGAVQLPGQAGGVNFNNILSNLMSGGIDRDKDGKVEISDLIAMVTNATPAQPQQQQQQGGGGIFDMLKGLMGS